MSESPKQKIMKLDIYDRHRKRENEIDPTTPSKRGKSDTQSKELLNSKKRKNFVVACKIVSYQAFCDYRQRLLLMYLPSCVSRENCTHYQDIRVIPEYVEESFKIDMRSNAWWEALDICDVIRPGHYLSANVLKDVVEIMMNAHENEYFSYTVDDILHRCQQILSRHFTAYPPCRDKQLRKCYCDFLTSPMPDKDNTFSNRTMFDNQKGIFTYCIRRLDYELNINSKDGPLVEIDEKIPAEIKQSVKGMHFQNEKLEILETLNRLDRIKRIMAVLESIVPLLQCDLAIWHSRIYKRNVNSSKIRSVKPFMAIILWSNNDLKTGTVTDIGRTIMKLFIYFVHLQYPQEYIKILLTLLNTMIQTFIFCDVNSNIDYPGQGKYSGHFAKEFVKIFYANNEMPHQSVLNVLEKLQPFFMQCKIATLYLSSVLYTSEDDILKFFINFIDKKSWEDFPSRNKLAEIPKKPIFSENKVKSFTKVLLKRCATIHNSQYQMHEDKCKKFNPNFKDNEPIYQDQVFFAFYIALQAYLHAYSILQVQETIDTLNSRLHDGAEDIEDNNIEIGNYSVSANFIKKYRDIYILLNKLMVKLREMQINGNLPDSFIIFENIGLIELEKTEGED